MFLIQYKQQNDKARDAHYTFPYHASGRSLWVMYLVVKVQSRYIDRYSCPYKYIAIFLRIRDSTIIQVIKHIKQTEYIK